MSWASILDNQCISLNNLQNAVNTGYFTLKNTIPAGTKQITKAEADYYVNIDTAYAPYAAKASNQLVVKSNLQPLAPYSYTIYYLSPKGYDRMGFDTKDDACAHNGVTLTVYSSSSTLSVGSPLYYLSDGVYYPATFKQYGGTGGIWIWNISTGAIRMTSSSSNVIAEIQACAASVRMFISFSNTSYGAVCTSLNRVRLFFDSNIGFGTGTSLWVDSALTIPYSNPNGYFYCAILYADGGNGHIYNFGGGNIVGSDIGIIC